MVKKARKTFGPKKKKSGASRFVDDSTPDTTPDDQAPEADDEDVVIGASNAADSVDPAVKADGGVESYEDKVAAFVKQHGRIPETDAELNGTETKIASGFMEPDRKVYEAKLLQEKKSKIFHERLKIAMEVDLGENLIYLVDDIVDSKNGQKLKLSNGAIIQMFNDFYGHGQFIGMQRGTNKYFDQAAAAVVIAGCKNVKGWTSINLSGKPAHMEMMWLEAMRAGLSVANFKPGIQSNAYKTWMAEKEKLENSTQEQDIGASKVPEPEKKSTFAAKLNEEKKPEAKSFASGLYKNRGKHNREKKILEKQQKLTNDQGQG